MGQNHSLSPIKQQLRPIKNIFKKTIIFLANKEIEELIALETARKT